MCLVMTNPVDILAVRHVKQGIEAGGFRTGHPSNYYLLLSNPNIGEWRQWRSEISPLAPMAIAIGDLWQPLAPCKW